MPKSNDEQSRYIEAESCPEWCNVDHSVLAQDAAAGRADQPALGYHSGHLTAADWPWVELEVTAAEGARLQVNVQHMGTMTAEQADALGQALVKGAQLLRQVA